MRVGSHWCGLGILGGVQGCLGMAILRGGLCPLNPSHPPPSLSLGSVLLTVPPIWRRRLIPLPSFAPVGLPREDSFSVMKKLAEEQGIDFHSPGLPKGKLFHTFTVGMGNSPDVMAARAMAKVLGTEHHERIFTPEEALSLIPTIVYRAETYEPELLRSCIPNYFLAELASQYVKMVLTGEGADELFSGYQYFFDAPTDDGGAALQKENRRIFGHLHQANLLRADRMTMSHGLEARVPFLDTTFVDSVRFRGASLYRLPAGPYALVLVCGLGCMSTCMRWVWAVSYLLRLSLPCNARLCQLVSSSLCPLLTSLRPCG